MKKLLFYALVGVFVLGQFGMAFGDQYYNVEIDESVENTPPIVNVYVSSSYGGPSDGANVTASKVVHFEPVERIPSIHPLHRSYQLVPEPH